MRHALLVIGMIVFPHNLLPAEEPAAKPGWQDGFEAD